MTNADNNPLKPCPFCGGKAIKFFSWGDKDWYVFCKKCGTTSKAYINAKEAVEAWNKRVKENKK